MILRSITTLISVSFLCLHSRLTLAQDTQGSPGQLTTRTQATSSQPVEVYVWGGTTGFDSNRKNCSAEGFGAETNHHAQ